LFKRLGSRHDRTVILDELSQPIALAPLAGATQTHLGFSGGCALSGGTVACWGLNALLGNGDGSHATPMPITLTCGP